MTQVRTSSATRIRLRQGFLALTTGALIATVADYLNRAVFPRLGDSRELTVNMTYTGPKPTYVEARIVDFTSGATVTDWTPLTGIVASNGSASGKLLVPQGCWYRLQVRGSSSQPPISGTVKFGVGVGVGWIGQSNAVGFARERYSAYPISNPNVLSLEGGVYKRIGQINDAFPPGTLYNVPGGYTSFTREGMYGDGMVFFTNALVEALGLPILVIDRSVNASNITEWKTGGQYWEAFASAVSAAGGDLEFLLFYQGEQNAANTSAAVMKQHWADMQQQFYSLTGRNASNSHFGLVSLGPGSWNGSQEGDFGKIRVAQIEFATSGIPGVFYVGGAHDSQTVDSVHLSPSHQSRMGKRWPRSILHRLGIGVSGNGPRIVSASRIGSVVDVTIQHSGGTALLDGVGGSGTVLTGFEFKDIDGSVLTYTSSITGPTSIQFTVNGVPAKMSYGLMNNPHNGGGSASAAFVPASAVYDNVSPGFPLQPCAEINITGG